MRKKVLRQWVVKAIIQWALRRAVTEPNCYVWFVEEVVSVLDTKTLVTAALRVGKKTHGTS